LELSLDQRENISQLKQWLDEEQEENTELSMHIEVFERNIGCQCIGLAALNVKDKESTAHKVNMEERMVVAECQCKSWTC